MKVHEVMRKQPVFCGLETTLAAAVRAMRESGCGFLPVVGEGGNVIGVITDRDICIALGTRNQKPSDVLVKDVMLPKQHTFPKLFTCTSDDDVHSALKTMRMARVRRIPVVDREGNLTGILSLDDIVPCACVCEGKRDICCKDVVDTLKAICAPPRPASGRRTAA